MAQEQSGFSAAQIDFFENKVRPILVEHCLECHGAKKDKLRGGLRLTSRQEILEGGDSGAGAISGDPDASLLMSAVHYDDFEMPPAGQLPEEEIAVLAKWIRTGLADPRQVERLLADLELSGPDIKTAATPGVKALPEEIAQEQKLQEGEFTKYRAIAARANYLSADRPDCQFAAKEICRWMICRRNCRWVLLNVSAGICLRVRGWCSDMSSSYLATATLTPTGRDARKHAKHIRRRYFDGPTYP